MAEKTLAADDIYRQWLNAQAIDKLWGASRATGGGALGLTARLTELRSVKPREISRPPCERTHAISVLVGGSAHSELRLNGKTRFSQVRRAGTFQLARAGESVNAVLSDSNGKCLDLYLPDKVLRECLERDFDQDSGRLELRDLGLERDSQITKLARTVLHELVSPDAMSNVAIDAATLSISVTLLRRWSNRSDKAPETTTRLPDWAVRRVSEFLKASLAENVTLADLAASVGLSPYHFLRAFKVSVGLPPHKFQMELRMDRARELLETTDVSVTEISAQVGYTDPSYLARQFRKRYGATPAEYRRELRH